MSDMEHLHSITPRSHSPAALFAFWISVFFLPGLLIIGLIQTVAADDEQQLRHSARGRLIQQLRLFERELDPTFYIESVTTRIIAKLNKGTRQTPETDFLSRAAPFLAAWRAETGALPLLAVFGNADLASISVTLSDPRVRPPLRIVSAWFRGLAGMNHRKPLRESDAAGISSVPFRTASKLMNEFLGFRNDIDVAPGQAVALFSTRRFGETVYAFLLLETVTHLPDSPVSGGCFLLVREGDISKRRLLRHAATLNPERGVARRAVYRPRRMSSLTASWKPAGRGLAIECAAPLALYDAHGRIDPVRMLFLRTEMRADKLVSPLRAHENATRALVMFAWLVSAVILLRLGFTGNLGNMPLRTKLVIILSIAVGLPLILFLLTATAYNRFSEILTRQERMNRLRQKLAQIESSVHSFGIGMQRRVIEIRNRLSATLGDDERAIRNVIQELAALRLYDSAYFIDSRGRTISIPLSDHERQVGALMAQRKIQFFYPSIVGVLKARGMLSPSVYEKLSASITPISGGVALLQGLSSTHTNDFIVQEGRSLDVEMPVLGPRHFQLFFPFKAAADGTVIEDAALMLIGRPELIPAATFDSLARTSSSYFREMDGEYETRIAIFRLDSTSTDRLLDTVVWPATAHSDAAVKGIARRAIENRWTGVLSRPDDSIEAARIFSRHPYIAVGIAEARGSLQQRGLSLTFWILAAYTLALLALAGHFLGRLFASPLDGLIAAVHRLRHGEFGLAVEIRSADEFEVIGNEISRMSRGVRERNRLRRFVSGLAADAAASGREAGTRVGMTILFAHIRDFSTVSEALGASGTVALLNGYFTAMEAAVVSHAGTIDKFIGDAVMAVFHPDRTGPNHPTAACRAAATMRKALIDFNLSRSASGEREIAIGIGIATGTVISGRVGSAIRRQDFTVIGDTVNLAARLSSLACSEGFGAVLMSGATASLLESSFNTRAAGEVRVKGKLEPVAVHELTGTEAG